ncbi:MAG: ATP-grasp domain-containing protein [Candidatus Bathyarchaeota archaeon]|nr:ATP-grasp domain-containing protein [Candidatus Bathyarchaeota archaeon]
MYTILFIGTKKSGSSREAIKAADRLGYLTVLLTEKRNYVMQRKEFSDVSQMIYLEELTEEHIRTEYKRLQHQGRIIKAIISFVDPYVSLAAQLMNELCNSDISVEAFKKMEDKILTRNTLQKNATTPKYDVFLPNDELGNFINKGHSYPLIVKSPVSGGSKDVYLVQNKFEMKKKIEKIAKLFPNQDILIEEYLDGPQYIVEVLVHKGNLNIIAIVKQDITKIKKFIVTGYEIQPNLEESLYRSLFDAVESIIKDLGVVNAACHLEIRHVHGNWKLIEINPRISGGAMNRMIEEAYGINLVEETIKSYLDNEPDLKRKHETYIYTHYLIINSSGKLLKVTGKNIATNLPGVREVYIKPRKGASMIPPVSMGQRYAYVIASGDTKEEARENAVNATSRIKFFLEPL